MLPLWLLPALPVITALLVILLPAKHTKFVSLAGTILQMMAVALLTVSFAEQRREGNSSLFLFDEKIEWFSSWNASLHFGVDGISVAMILLTSLVVTAGILVSWNIEKQGKEFFILLLLLASGAYGFFISLDLFTLFCFLEIAVIPKFMLIGIWGSGNKNYSANKLALMLMAGSALILVGILFMYYQMPIGKRSFDFVTILSNPLPLQSQLILFPLVFVGFGIFTAIFPFHTWVPDGHSSAPTAGSMFLAGISMKLGGYGCLRVATTLMPEAAQHYSIVIVILAAIAIVYGAFATMMQTDLKYINAYSSISHCGFVLLGIGMLTKSGINGAVFQMVSHGLMTALFFAVIGMMYARTHTRKVSEMGGLLKTIPFISAAMFIAGLCSLGLPGLSGFPAEMTVFMGGWERPETIYRVVTVLACMSIVITAVYILRAIGSTVMGPVKNREFEELPKAMWNEKLAAVILIAGIVIMGVLPFVLYKLVNPATQEIIKQMATG
ncbi:NADH-quinone oxidoreductase subunit M [Pollutibacter soli]|uniref:complex I subunit 4 family protein n=1 Tax=Pollutibacter soli TaxID=3034157 RepID=UPI0030137360